MGAHHTTPRGTATDLAGVGCGQVCVVRPHGRAVANDRRRVNTQHHTNGVANNHIPQVSRVGYVGENTATSARHLLQEVLGSRVQTRAKAEGEELHVHGRLAVDIIDDVVAVGVTGLAVRHEQNRAVATYSGTHVTMSRASNGQGELALAHVCTYQR